MKKIITTLLLITTLIMTNSIFANYTPTAEDEKSLALLEKQIKEMSKTPKDLWDFYHQFKTLQHQFNDTKHEKVHYLLSSLSNRTYQMFKEQKKQAKNKSSFQNVKQNLVNQHLKYINTEDKELLKRCLDHYDIIDDISFANNFPTALTMATRYRESSCSFDTLPNNGDGPFQIVTKDYGTGTMNEATFIQTVEDFIKFSRKKYQRYQEKIKVNLDYTTIDLESVINHGALYNGGKKVEGIVVPYAPDYVLDRYQGKYYNKQRRGIRPFIVKFLERELGE